MKDGDVAGEDNAVCIGEGVATMDVVIIVGFNDGEGGEEARRGMGIGLISPDGVGRMVDGIELATSGDACWRVWCGFVGVFCVLAEL
jgi:hypothetical protein